MNIIGIDPGKKGAIACISQGKCATFKMPLLGSDLDGRVIADLLRNADLVVIEKVHSMPKQGVASTFTFGMGYGRVIGVAEALGLRIEYVTPQAWKAAILSGTKKDKDAAIMWAGNAYPCSFKRTEGECEAIAIAEYGRRNIALEG